MTRRDDVSNLYKTSNMLKKICTWLFWCNCSISIFVIVFGAWLGEWTVIIQIVIAVLYVVILVIDDCYFWYYAEAARRKASIENAFGIDITNLTIEGYYNNKQNNSLIRYCLNTFESTFFSRRIAKAMMWGEGGKAVICLLVIIVACIKLDCEIVLVISQALFSAELLTSVVSLIVYQNRLDFLYDIFYHDCITVGIKTKEQIYALLASVVEYEAVKAHYKVRLSTRMYERMNQKLTDEWDDIEKKVVISLNCVE